MHVVLHKLHKFHMHLEVLGRCVLNGIIPDEMSTVVLTFRHG